MMEVKNLIIFNFHYFYVIKDLYIFAYDQKQKHMKLSNKLKTALERFFGSN